MSKQKNDEKKKSNKSIKISLANSDSSSLATLLSNVKLSDKALPKPNNEVTISREKRTANRRKARLQRMKELSKYDGLMRPFDIDKIVRINISNLVSVDPLLDDFYFQIHSIRSGNSEPNSIATGAGKLIPPLLERGKNHNLYQGKTLQDQISKMVLNAKARPKATQVKLDGALGNVAIMSAKTPRTALVVSNDCEESPGSSPVACFTRGTRIEMQRAAEDVYALVIDIELLYRRVIVANSEIDDGDDSVEKSQSLQQTMLEKDQAIEKLWAYLSNSFGDKLPKITTVFGTIKGMRLFPRISRLLSHDQTRLILEDFFRHLQSLNVVCKASLPAQFAAPSIFPGIEDAKRPLYTELVQYSDEVSCFMTYVLPIVVSHISDADWDRISAFINVLLEYNDLARVCASRVGLSVLTMLVSRAEILRQANQAPTWTSIFTPLFNQIQGNFHRFFPVSTIPGIESSKLELELTDDTSIWQFLAALAVASSPEQQESIIVQVRDRILSIVTAGKAENADRSMRRSYKNVAVFLQALGLQNF